MKTPSYLTALPLAFPLLASAYPSYPLKRGANGTAVDSSNLRATIDQANLLAKSQTLEGFAYATKERNRVFGGPGHNATVNYLYDQIAALGDYYTVDFQPFVELYSAGSASVAAKGGDQAASLLTYSPSGEFSEALVAAANFGCEATEFPPEVAGAVALISRGTCEFGLKSALAGAAGADAAIIYNNVEGPLAGTLGAPPRLEGDYVPTAGISLADGTALAAAIDGGAAVTPDVNIESIQENRTTYNVVAQTKGGDPNNVLVLTAHTDYVSQLSLSELGKIRLNLNFDMIASPNCVYAIYDGDGSAFGTSGPPGSAEAEKLFEDYFKNEAGLNTVPTEFDGRSEYGPFLDAGIPTGGLFTGAEGIKTAEEHGLFGGEADVAYDINYHGAGDNVSNLNLDPFLENRKAIAYAVGTYGSSFDSLLLKPPVVAVSRFARSGKKTLSGEFD